MDKMPDGNSYAEREHSATQAKREAIADEYREPAILSIIDDVCSGHYVRANGKRLYAVHFIEYAGIDEIVMADELAAMATLHGEPAIDARRNVERRLEKAVRDWCESDSGLDAVEERINALNDNDQQRYGGRDDE